jgi:hypothetical protein
MKLNIILTLLLLNATWELRAQTSLDDYRQEVIDFSHEVHISALNSEASKADMRQANKGYLPALSMGAEANLDFRETTPERPWSWLADVTLSQTIYNGGAVRATAKRRAALYAKSEAEEQIAEEAIEISNEAEAETDTVEAIAEQLSNDSTTAQEYVVASLPNRVADSASFSQGYYTDTVVKDIKTIIATEAPISRRLLIKRLLTAYGISRNGVRINTYLGEVFEDMGLATSGTEDIFYWKDKEQLEHYSGYRLASEREALDIAPEEVAQAVVKVVQEQFAIDESGLVNETARLFGFNYAGDNISASMKRGINLALTIGLITIEANRYKLPY